MGVLPGPKKISLYTGFTVREMFTTTGAAYLKLGELTVMLVDAAGPTPSSGKWTDEEFQMAKAAVKHFAEGLGKVCTSIKNRTINEVKTSMKRKMDEDASIRSKKNMITITAPPVTHKKRVVRTKPSVITPSKYFAGLTLNATKPDMDVKRLTGGNKLDYDIPDAP